MKSKQTRLVVLKDGTQFIGYKAYNFLSWWFNDEAILETTYIVTEPITIGLAKGDKVKIGAFSLSYFKYVS